MNRSDSKKAEPKFSVCHVENSWGPRRLPRPSLSCPRHVLGGAGQSSANNKLNIAGIGVGGQGGGDMNALSSENIVALCDVDEDRAAGTFNKFPNARKYKDFRQMLEKEHKNIDAVMVATPDHCHAPAAIMAMKMGKHVYCEKPMAHTIYEARRMTEVAKEMKVVTQMGQGGHAGEGLRLTYEYHPRRRDRPGSRGPRLERPARHGGATLVAAGHRATDGYVPVPAGLDWDLWLGPARWRPYAIRTAEVARPRTVRSTGEAGGISAAGPWATWPCTTPTRRSSASISTPRWRSRPRPARSTTRPCRSGRSSRTSSRPGATVRRSRWSGTTAASCPRVRRSSKKAASSKTTASCSSATRARSSAAAGPARRG